MNDENEREIETEIEIKGKRKCKNCGKIWVPRKIESRMCPDCKSLNWDEVIESPDTLKKAPNSTPTSLEPVPNSESKIELEPKLEKPQRQYLGVTEEEMDKLCRSTGKYGVGVFDPGPYCESRRELAAELHTNNMRLTAPWIRDFKTWLRISHSIGKRYPYFVPHIYSPSSTIRQNIIEGVRKDFDSGYALDLLVNKTLDEVIAEVLYSP